MMSLYSMAVTRVKHIKQWNANIFFSSCRSCSSAVIFAHQLSYLFISCYFCLSVAIFIHKFGLLVLGFVFSLGGGGCCSSAVFIDDQYCLFIKCYFCVIHCYFLVISCYFCSSIVMVFLSAVIFVHKLFYCFISC